MPLYTLWEVVEKTKFSVIRKSTRFWNHQFNENDVFTCLLFIYLFIYLFIHLFFLCWQILKSLWRGKYVLWRLKFCWFLWFLSYLSFILKPVSWTAFEIDSLTSVLSKEKEYPRFWYRDHFLRFHVDLFLQLKGQEKISRGLLFRDRLTRNWKTLVSKKFSPSN